MKFQVTTFKEERIKGVFQPGFAYYSNDNARRSRRNLFYDSYSMLELKVETKKGDMSKKVKLDWKNLQV